MAEFSASDGVTIHYEVEGTQYGPPLVFSNSLGTNLHMWDGQVGEATELGFRVIRYDQRGHGQSAAPKENYSLARLADDLAELLNTLRIEKTAFCGLSMGGMTGIHLGKRHPPRFTRLALCNTAAFMAPREMWDARIKAVTEGGMEAVVDAVVERWFTPSFRQENPERGRAHPRDDPLHRAGRICRLLRRDPRHGRARPARPDRGADAGADRRARSGNHAGEGAVSSPSGFRARRNRCSIRRISPTSSGRRISTASSSGSWQESKRERRSKSETAERGMKVRRAVLGDAHVDRATAGITDFNRDFQDLITRYAWGEIWSRPGLDRKTRSCMVLTAMIALGAWDEFRMHVRAAFNNGLTEDDIKEVILQAAIYCGVPAANHAFKEAAGVIAERDAGGASDERSRHRLARSSARGLAGDGCARCRCGRRSSERYGSPERHRKITGGMCRSI